MYMLGQGSAMFSSEPQVWLVVDHVPVERLPEGHEPRPVQMALVPDELVGW